MDDLLNAKEELRNLLELFIANPYVKSIVTDAINLEKKYAGLASLNDFFKKEPVSDLILKTIGFLDKIYSFGDGSFDDSISLNTAKELLKSLK